MVARRINKFWFLLKVLFLILFVALTILVVTEKDIVVEEFCECTPCEFINTNEKKTIWQNLADAFCMCPSCD